MDGKTNTPIPAERQLVGGRAKTTVARPEERPALISTPIRQSADGESQNRFRPGELQKVVALQCRLLATRADAGLPLDSRSLLNLIRVSRDLIDLSAAA